MQVIIPISTQLFSLISLAIGFLLTTVIFYLTFNYHKSRIKEIFIFWGNLSLVSFNLMIDMVLLETNFYPVKESHGTVLALIAGLCLIITFPYFNQRLKNIMKYKTLIFNIVFSILLILVLLTTHWTIYATKTRYILCSILVLFITYNVVYLVVTSYKHKVLKDLVVKVLTLFLLIFYIIFVINDLLDANINSYPIFPMFYAVLSIYISLILHKSRKTKFDKSYNLITKYNLTDREMDVVKELLKGASYKLVGTNLNVSINTVRTHVNSIYKKCGVKNKVELITLI